MKRDTMTLSQFVRKENQELRQEIISLHERAIHVAKLRKALPVWQKYRKHLHKVHPDPEAWPLREHPGDFSQSLDRFVERMLK